MAVKLALVAAAPRKYSPAGNLFSNEDNSAAAAPTSSPCNELPVNPNASSVGLGKGLLKRLDSKEQENP